MTFRTPAIISMIPANRIQPLPCCSFTAPPSGLIAPQVSHGTWTTTSSGARGLAWRRAPERLVDLLHACEGAAPAPARRGRGDVRRDPRRPCLLPGRPRRDDGEREAARPARDGRGGPRCGGGTAGVALPRRARGRRRRRARRAGGRSLLRDRAACAA